MTTTTPRFPSLRAIVDQLGPEGAVRFVLDRARAVRRQPETSEASRGVLWPARRRPARRPGRRSEAEAGPSTAPQAVSGRG